MVAASSVRQSFGVAAVCLSTVCACACAREQRFVREHLEAMPGVASVRVSCDGGDVDDPDECATVVMRDGAELQFFGLGYRSFGPTSSRVRVGAARGRSPLIVSCQSDLGVMDVHAGGLFGHHFSPAIGGVSDAIRRHRELIEELEFWPQCPQFWELQPAPGLAYRYCAHGSDVLAEPPPRPCAQSFDSAK